MDSAGAAASSAEATFADMLQQLRAALPQGQSIPVSVPLPQHHDLPQASPMVNPSLFSGSVEECSGFILQCQLVLEMRASQFSTEHSKFAYVISLLKGRALQWAHTIWDHWGTLRRCSVILQVILPFLNSCFVFGRGDELSQIMLSEC